MGEFLGNFAKHLLPLAQQMAPYLGNMVGNFFGGGSQPSANGQNQGGGWGNALAGVGRQLFPQMAPYLGSRVGNLFGGDWGARGQAIGGLLGDLFGGAPQPGQRSGADENSRAFPVSGPSLGAGGFPQRPVPSGGFGGGGMSQSAPPLGFGGFPQQPIPSGGFGGLGLGGMQPRGSSQFSSALAPPPGLGDGEGPTLRRGGLPPVLGLGDEKSGASFLPSNSGLGNSYTPPFLGPRKPQPPLISPFTNPWLDD